MSEGFRLHLQTFPNGLSATASKIAETRTVERSSEEKEAVEDLGGPLEGSWGALGRLLGGSWEGLGRLLEASKRHLGPKTGIATIFKRFLKTKKKRKFGQVILATF